MTTATIRAGVSAHNANLFHAMRFEVGDPAAFLEVNADNEPTRKILIIRDVELDRARTTVRGADEISCPADYLPAGGLSSDREIATAQAAAECLRRNGVTRVVGDRSLPLSFAEILREAGLEVVCDFDFGVRSRRQKNAGEIEHIRNSQLVTEGAIRLACETIARAEAGPGGVLLHGGRELTSERIRALVHHYFVDRGFTGPQFIIAGGAHGAIGHHIGHGPLHTGHPVVVDIYPTDCTSHYCGDCTRTVVHGKIPDEIADMHATVLRAKAAAIASIRAGVTGKEVHSVTCRVIEDSGYVTGVPGRERRDNRAILDHGTGHGIGLEVHEPPLLDWKGIELLEGDVVTVEPGLYKAGLGGVRVEDIVAVTAEGCENLNTLPEGLDWK